MNTKPFSNFELTEKLLAIGSSTEKRTKLVNLFLTKPAYLPMLLELCFSGKPKISAKACRLLEFVCNIDLSIILPYSKEFFSKIGLLEKDAEIRPAGKICELLMIAHYVKKDAATQLYILKPQREKIIETCFHWMLSDQKVAAQAHAMTCLQLLGTEFTWIYPELKIILDRNYASKSAGYQARARMVLKKMKP